MVAGPLVLVHDEHQPLAATVAPVREALLLRPATVDDLPLLLRTETPAGASFNWSGYRDGNRLRGRLEGNGLLDDSAGTLVLEAVGEAVARGVMRAGDPRPGRPVGRGAHWFRGRSSTGTCQGASGGP